MLLGYFSPEELESTTVFFDNRKNSNFHLWLKTVSLVTIGLKICRLQSFSRILEEPLKKFKVVCFA